MPGEAGLRVSEAKHGSRAAGGQVLLRNGGWFVLHDPASKFIQMNTVFTVCQNVSLKWSLT